MNDPDLRAFLSIGERAEEAAQVAAKSLAAAAHAKVVEEAHAKLHHRLPAFLSALRQEEEEGAYLIVLDKSAAWIEDGMQPHDMLADLLRSPKAKTSKSGTRYISIPFEHASTAPGGRPVAASHLADAIRHELRQRGLFATKIERDQAGQPLFGKLHTLRNVGGPKARDRSGLGKGTPLLEGLNIYQHPASNKAGATRSLVTYRTASSSQEGTGAWQHPGLEPAHVMEAAAEWAEKEWSERIFPEMLEALTGIRTMR